MSDSPAVFDSAQKHWLQSNGVLGHTHIDLDCTNKPKVKDVLVVNFAIHLFRVTGEVGPIYAGNYKTSDAFDWFWDATGSSTPPPMQGDPNGEVIFTGHFSTHPYIPHGWEWVSMSVYTIFVNPTTRAFERNTVVMLNQPFYSIVDLTIPSPNDLDPGSQRSQAVGRVSPTLLPNGEPDNNAPFYGEESIQFDTSFNREPFDTTQDLTSSSYGYGSRNMPMAVFDVVEDADLHHDVPGTTLYKFIEPIGGLIHAPTPMVPAVLGNGTHKIMLRRTMQQSGEISAVLFVTHMTVGPFVPPPQVAVPNTVGQTEEAAQNACSAAGLLTSNSHATNDAPAGTIFAQDPPAGTLVNVGSTVHLSVSTGPAPTDEWVTVDEPITVQKFGSQDKYRLVVAGHVLPMP